jgi:hypothetical protein
MNLTVNKNRQQRLFGLSGTLALLLIIAGLAWLSHRYQAQVDLTANNSNTLSSASQKLLISLPEKIEITAFIKTGLSLRPQIAQLVARYQRFKPNLTITFIDPDLHPEQTRELAIGKEGAILVAYQDRIEKLKFVDESSLTNALLHLANAKERWITFLSGHGERAIDGKANFDLGQFGKELSQRKIVAQTQNLTVLPEIPSNSNLLVITAPAAPFLEGEITIIKNYIAQGGNLLLLTDPGDKYLQALESDLGIERLTGTLVDNGSKFYGLKDPSFILVNSYPEHAIFKDFQTITLYPVTAALSISPTTPFKAEALLNSSKDSWTELDSIAGQIQLNTERNEKQGPLTFAYALSRKTDAGNEQRIVVIGDGDFLSNAYIGNVGNLDMGLRVVSWINHDDGFININAKTATDKSLRLSELTVATMGFGYLIFIPLLLMTTGLIIWRKRKQS